MNKIDAKIIAEYITNKELGEMLEVAKKSIIDWTKRSAVNKGMTLGVSWNILGETFDISKKQHNIVKVNMIREFGEFLPEHLKPKKISKSKLPPPIHQEPKFK